MPPVGHKGWVLQAAQGATVAAVKADAQQHLKQGFEPFAATTQGATLILFLRRPPHAQRAQDGS